MDREKIITVQVVFVVQEKCFFFKDFLLNVINLKKVSEPFVKIMI